MRRTYIGNEGAGNHGAIVAVYQVMSYWRVHTDYWFLLGKLRRKQAAEDEKEKREIGGRKVEREVIESDSSL